MEDQDLRVCVAEQSQQIHSLFRRQEAIERLAESVEDIARSVVRLTTRLESVDSRISAIESARSSRGQTVFACALTAVLSGLGSFLLSRLV